MNIKLGKYQHYKGKMYEVIGIARHSETLDELVIYRALYNDKQFGPSALWARPIKMFTEMVILNNKKVPRFKYMGENE